MFDIDKESRQQRTRSDEQSAYSGINIAGHLQDISHLSKDYVREMRHQLGRIAHQLLTTAQQEGHIDGLAIADDACPGMVGDALCNNDGSSNYLRFTMTMIDEAAKESACFYHDANMEAPEQGRIKLLSRCAHDNRLDADLLIGTIPADDGSIGFSIFCGQQTHQIHFSKTSESLRKLSPSLMKELAAVGCLCALINTCDRLLHTDSRPTIESLVTTLPFQHLDDTEQEYLDRTKTIREASAAAWKHLSEYHESYRLPPIALGESFTLGKLAQCLGAQNGRSDQLAYAFGWYHPDAKKIFGVAPEQLEDDTIAEIATVLQGASGLLTHGYGSPGIALATSGWANNDWLKDSQTGKVNDFFSVAAAYKQEDTSHFVGLRVSLPDTANSQTSPSRRLYTRELGVLASLYVLSRALNDDQTSMTLQHVSDDLMRILSEYGTCHEELSRSLLT